MAALQEAFDRAERAEQRAERLQHRIDEQNALVTTLRRELQRSSQSTQVVAQQVRLLQGAPNADAPPGGSVASLQRSVTTLRDKLDVEKKAVNAAHSERARLEQRLASAARERQALLASQQELRAELQRRNSELEKAHAALKESDSSYEVASGKATSLSRTRERERSELEKEMAELRNQLELERRRATNRATRATAAEAALRRAREQQPESARGSAAGSSLLGGSESGSEVGGRVGSIADGSSSSGGTSARRHGPSVVDLDMCDGRRALDFEEIGGDVYGGGTAPSAAMGLPPSASVAGMRAELEGERDRREVAEGALARAEADHEAEVRELRASLAAATARADESEGQLERRELEHGGTGARAALRALERQVGDATARATAAEARAREASSQLRSVLASLCTLADVQPPSTDPAE